MKERVLMGVCAVALLAALLCGATEGYSAEPRPIPKATTPSVDRTAFYMASYGLNGFSLDFELSPSVGTSTLYVRGQTFNDNLMVGNIEPAWLNSEQSADNGTSQQSSYGSSVTRTFWVASTYNELRVKGESVMYKPDQKSQYSGQHIWDFSPFHQTRVGLQGAVTWTGADNRNSVSALVSYGRGHMKQVAQNYLGAIYFSDESGNLVIRNEWPAMAQNIQTRVNVSDMQFGGSWIHTMDCGAKLTTTVLGGFQDYGWRRDVRYRKNKYNADTGSFEGVTNDEFSAAVEAAKKQVGLEDLEIPEIGNDNVSYVGLTSGNTLGLLVSISKEFELGYGWSWAPRLDFESVHSWIYASAEKGHDYHQSDSKTYTEEGHDYHQSDSKTYTEAWQPYDMSGHKLIADRNTFRGGASITYADENGDLTLMAMYGHQLENGFGINVSSSTFNEVVKSSSYGQESLLTGARLGRWLNAEQTMQISGDYQLTLYKKASNQMISAGFFSHF